MRDVQFHFENKNFVVVGASSGMGRQIALDLAESGAQVLAVARNEKRLEEVRLRYPQQVMIASLDVLSADRAAWDHVLVPFVEKRGKCHGGVYTAGISDMTPLRMYDEEIARRIVDTSFWGMTRFIQSLAKKKYASEGSSFVVFSSTAAYCGNKGQFAYSAAKGAVQTAVRSLAKEICKDRHRINSISPGWVASDMTKKSIEELGEIRPAETFAQYLLGLGKPDDISGMALFLLSDAARWITGTDVVVDGGSLLGTN